MRRILATLCVLLAFTLLVVPRAEARRKRTERLDQRRLKLKRLIKRGALPAMRARMVRVAGRRDVSIGELADRALKPHRLLQQNLRKARRALQKDAVVEEEAIETEDSTLLVATVKATVVDPGQVKALVPELGDLGGASARSKIRASQLTGEALQNFQEIKAELAREAPDHPLRLAMQKGDDALLDAMAQGKGDVEVTTTVVIPKLAPVLTNGVLQVPAVTDAGFDYGAVAALKLAPMPGVVRAPLIMPGLAALPPLLEAPVKAPPPAPKTTTSGKVTEHHNFILGNTVSGYWEWEHHYGFLNADITISAGATYGFGLRVPVKVTTVLEPRKITYTADKDASQSFTVDVTARTLDAGVDFYKEAGMSGSDLQDGHEFVLNASAYLNVRGSVDLWLAEPSINKGVSLGFDYDRNFVPPHGDCGRSCGFDFWIPADVTRTSFDFSVLKGSAQVGFWVAGDGEVGMDYESWYGAETIKSKLQGNEKLTHRLTFDKEQTRKITTPLTTMTMAKGVTEREKDYGYRISEPTYKWDVEVTPGLKGNLTVDLGVWDHRFNLGPWWFDWASVDLGTFELDRHKGTFGAYKQKDGLKTWKKPKG